MLVLLNAGGFTLVSGWRDTDRYGRKLRTVTRAARSLGETLVEEGLAGAGTSRDAMVRPRLIAAVAAAHATIIGFSTVPYRGRIVTGGRNRFTGSVRLGA
ncbi:putative staphylococcal nuclease (plasmid) [Bradyrhizobium diazoefficiens]|uniref:Putative staphylococcal nuclease n=1 Tax=Bradyrhizobium diazoefficiens TaxID=1355477 RepID=A0A0E4FZI1_9BRAD|nr:putative staphylococcal nuclease [Bradyrhizobium diazoefficiens]